MRGYFIAEKYIQDQEKGENNIVELIFKTSEDGVLSQVTLLG